MTQVKPLRHYCGQRTERCACYDMPDAYNGWANYETWNVALWIQNNPGLHTLAKQFKGQPAPYRKLVAILREKANPKDYTNHQIAFETPDNVAWDSADLDINALNKLLEAL